MTKLVLQINSLEVLERMIGGDSEIELNIRQSIVDAFAKKYLKNIAVTNLQELVKQINNEMNSTAKSLIDDELKKLGVSDSRYYLNFSDDYKKKIRGFVNEQVIKEQEKALDKSVEKQLDAIITDEYIEKAIAKVLKKKLS